MSPRFERRSGGPSRDGRQGGASSGRSPGGTPTVVWLFQP
jgi:23S rRNA (guanosine2251-2'-O)-methyltransferase